MDENLPPKWVVTGTWRNGKETSDIRQVYPNEKEAERYAASRRGRRGYSGMTVHPPGDEA